MRQPRRFDLIRSLLLLGTVTTSSVVSPRVSVLDSLSCPGPLLLQRSLDGQLGDGVAVVGAKGSSAATLDLFPAVGSRFTVRLTSRASAAETTIDAHQGSCVELANAVALLVQGWLADLPPDEMPVPLPSIAASTPSAAAASTPRPIDVAATLASAPPEISQVAATSTRSSGGVRPSLAVSMDAVTAQGLSLGASAFAELSLLAHWGIGVRLSLLPSLSGADDQGGGITVEQQAVALLIGYSILVATPTTPAFGVHGGPLLLHSAAQEVGLTQGRSYDRWQPALFLGFRVAQPLSQLFFFFGELDGQVTTGATQFQVSAAGAPPTTLVTVPAWRLSLSLGAGVNLF